MSASTPTIAAAIAKAYTDDDSDWFQRYHPNRWVYRRTLEAIYKARGHLDYQIDLVKHDGGVTRVTQKQVRFLKDENKISLTFQAPVQVNNGDLLRLSYQYKEITTMKAPYVNPGDLLTINYMISP